MKVLNFHKRYSADSTFSSYSHVEDKSLSPVNMADISTLNNELYEILNSKIGKVKNIFCQH